MKAIALVVRHKAKPGQRDMLHAVWEKYVRPAALRNSGHLAYHFCFDEADQDRVVAFQIFANLEAKDAFLKNEWYPAYLKDISAHIAEPPDITAASIIWSKPIASN